MVTLPPVPTPVTSPVPPPGPVVTVAMLVLELLHVPPFTALLSVIVAPEHTARGPNIAPGFAGTVTTVVVKHPVVAAINVITDVPALTPVTLPPPTGPGVTVATLGVALVHVPPPGAVFVKLVTAPIQTVVVPAISGGNALTVTNAVTEQPVPIE
jgi:hypothetical protein